MTDYSNFLSGLVAAPHTPMHPDGSLLLESVEKQARHLVQSRVTGAFICGSTGEGQSLSLEERRQLADRWAAARRTTPLKLIVHVGSNCLGDAQALADHAQRIGADAISAMAPYYFKPSSVDELVSYCADVSAAAPDLPFYYYDIPALTGVGFPMLDYLVCARERITNLAGIKYTNPDLVEFQRCVQFEGGRYNMLFGCDEILLAGLALGANGAVGSTYNYAAPIYHQLLKAFHAGDVKMARSLQLKSVELVRVLMEYGVLPAGKAIMGMLGVECGPVRPPLKNLTVLQRKDLEEKISSFGILSNQPIRS